MLSQNEIDGFFRQEAVSVTSEQIDSVHAYLLDTYKEASYILATKVRIMLNNKGVGQREWSQQEVGACLDALVANKKIQRISGECCESCGTFSPAPNVFFFPRTVQCCRCGSDIAMLGLKRRYQLSEQKTGCNS